MYIEVTAGIKELPFTIPPFQEYDKAPDPVNNNVSPIQILVSIPAKTVGSGLTNTFVVVE